MKRTTASDGREVSDVRFLIDQAKNGSPDVIGHTVVAALLEVLSALGDWLILPCFLYMLESNAPRFSVLVVLAVVVALLRFAAMYEQGAFARSRDRFRTQGCTRLAQKALSMPYAAVVDATQRRVLSRASQALGRHIEAPVARLWKTFSSLLTYTLAAAVYSAVLCRYHIGLWCAVMFTAVLGAMVHRFVSDRGVRDGEKVHDATLDYVSKTAQSPPFSKDIRVFSLAPWLKAVYDSGFRAVQELSRRRAKTYALYDLAEALLILLSNGLAYLMLLHAAAQATLSVAALCLYIAAVGGLTWAVRGFAEDWRTLGDERAELATYRRFLENTDPLDDGKELPTQGGLHRIDVCDVSFTKPGETEPTFEHLSFTWHRGETLAVVVDGRGKSELLQLLCGLYTPDEGVILLDGIDVKTIRPRDYYALFSTVLQNTSLPDMTVAELVAPVGMCDEARLHDCLAKAGAASFAAALPQGIHTVIGCTASDEGVELSGGQMQRLLLARALYKDGDLFVFDEPTAALDPLAESALYRDYERFTQDKGALFASYRPAATRFCDRILVLKNGVIREEGTHEELLKQGGDYARLFALQSRYYREGRDPS